MGEMAANHSDDRYSDLFRRIGNLIPSVEDEKLDNGSRLLLSSSRVPRTEFTALLLLNAGSRIEEPHQQGLLHFFEHMYPACHKASNGSSLIQFSNRNAWDLDIDITHERIAFSFTAPDLELEGHHGAESVVSELLTMLEAPRFNDRQFEIERNRILDEIQKTSEDLFRVKTDFIIKTRYQGTGYEHPIKGTKDLVRSYSLQDVVALSEELFTADRMTLCMSGNPDSVAQFKRQAREFLASRPVARDVKQVAIAKPNVNFEGQTYLHETDLTQSANLSFVFPSVDPTNFEDVAVSSLIYNSLVYQLGPKLSHSSGLTYSYGLYRVPYQGDSYWVLDVACSPEKVAEVTKVIGKTLSELLEGITDNELDDLKRSYFVATYKGLEKYTLDNRMVKAAVHNTEYRSLIDDFAVIQEVETADFIRVARQSFDLSLATSFMFAPEQILDGFRDWQGLRN